MATTTVPNEETPLLGGQQALTTKGVAEPESEVDTLAGSHTPSVKSGTNANGGPDAVKKTPLPWPQLSIVLILELAEPLTSQVISPVSSPIDSPSHFPLWRRLVPYEVQSTADRPFFHSSHPRSVRKTSRICESAS